MRLRRFPSFQELSAAVCAFTVLFSLSGIPAANETDAMAAIGRYCSVSWRNAGIDSQDWEDCTQDAVMLLLERIPRHRLAIAIYDADSSERRELTRTVWCITQRWRRSSKLVSLDDCCLCDCVSDQSDIAEQMEQVERAACVCLTARQRQIFSLRLKGYSNGEIAEKMELTKAQVSDEKYKAIKKLREQLVA
jgi:RNA polymerase sigma factor (sigma-70 family)